MVQVLGRIDLERVESIEGCAPRTGERDVIPAVSARQGAGTAHPVERGAGHGGSEGDLDGGFRRHWPLLIHASGWVAPRDVRMCR